MPLMLSCESIILLASANHANGPITSMGIIALAHRRVRRAWPMWWRISMTDIPITRDEGNLPIVLLLRKPFY